MWCLFSGTQSLVIFATLHVFIAMLGTPVGSPRICLARICVSVFYCNVIVTSLKQECETYTDGFTKHNFSL
jgi:hypothetical protein